MAPSLNGVLSQLEGQGDKPRSKIALLSICLGLVRFLPFTFIFDEQPSWSPAFFPSCTDLYTVL